MVSHENSPTSNPPRARVCATCHDLGTVESPLPGMHVLCPTCCNGTPRPSEPEPLPFTLPPESPVSAAERAEGDRLDAVASASNPPDPLLWATVDEAADVLTIRRGTRVEIEVPLSLLRVYRRHDDLVPRLVAAGFTGLLIGGAFGWFAPAIAMWLLGLGA